MSQLAELRALPTTELRQRALGLRKELAVLRLKLRQGGNEPPHRARLMRRQIAQLLTIAQGQEHASRKSS
ncbi:MAG: 50S ribosomal protein L29 [Candidatus Omnitrophica bacterium]|nr:50S ribosomal protein L29 [Candidatus Omnitrophota bacterium]